MMAQQMKKKQRLTHKTRGARADKGSIYLTPRDLSVLTWIGQQYVVCLDQLQVVLGQEAGGATRAPGRLSLKRTRALVDRWSGAGLVHQQKILAGMLSFTWLTLAGMRQVGLSYRVYTPRVGQLLLCYYVNQARLFLQEQFASQQAVWKSERQLRSEEGVRTARGRRKKPHIVDGEVILVGERKVAVEVELTAKTLSKLIHIISELAERYDQIWYFASPSLLPLLEEAVEHLELEQQRSFQLYALSVLSPGGERP